MVTFKILLLLVYIPVQTNSTIPDQTVDAQLQSYQQAQIKTLSSKVDSLQTEIEKLKISEKYFASILSDQVTIFSTIVAIIVALLGLVGWSIFYQSFYKRLKYAEQKVEEIELTSSELRTDILTNSSYGNQMSAVHNIYNQEYAYSTLYYLLSIDEDINRIKTIQEMESSEESNNRINSIIDSIKQKLGSSINNTELINSLGNEDKSRECEIFQQNSFMLPAIFKRVISLSIDEEEFYQKALTLQESIKELIQEAEEQNN